MVVGKREELLEKYSEKIIDGNKLSAKLYETMAEKVQDLKSNNIHPSLAFIIVGNNPASQVYIKNKRNRAKELKVDENLYELPESVSTDELLFLIQTLNEDENIHGILVQLPLPKHIDTDKIINCIDHRKDVDAFHPLTAGQFYLNGKGVIPCTALGCKLLIESVSEIAGKNIIVIGRSNIVGKPLSQLLLKENATITIAHSYTKNLAELSRQQDIVVVAMGKPKFLTSEYVKDGAIVIDVGINRGEDGLVGDADFESLIEKVSYITPVPGGVGPMTVACVFSNLLKLIELYHR